MKAKIIELIIVLIIAFTAVIVGHYNNNDDLHELVNLLYISDSLLTEKVNLLERIIHITTTDSISFDVFYEYNVNPDSIKFLRFKFN